MDFEAEEPEVAPEDAWASGPDWISPPDRGWTPPPTDGAAPPSPDSGATPLPPADPWTHRPPAEVTGPASTSGAEAHRPVRIWLGGGAAALAVGAGAFFIASSGGTAATRPFAAANANANANQGPGGSGGANANQGPGGTGGATGSGSGGNASGGANANDGSNPNATPGSGSPPGQGPFGAGEGMAPGPRDGRGAFGTLASVSGSSFTVKTPDGGSLTATTSASTVITKAVTGAVSDVKVGDAVVVMGSPSGTNAVTAEHITDRGAASTQSTAGAGAPGQAGGPDGGPPRGGFTTGTVATVAGATLAVKTDSGSTVTVTTDSATTVVDVRPTTLQGLTIGQPVDVRGTTNSAGVVVASAVEQGDAHGRPDGDGPGGRWQPGE